ncbi:MAG: hypothetical protein AAF316_14325 [Cyanobacteria bacterium P01_A01_bin.80]
MLKRANLSTTLVFVKYFLFNKSNYFRNGLTIDHINKRNLSINSEALSNALSLIRQNPTYEDCLKIAVWHHSLNSTFGDRITDSGVMERLAAAGFRFILHGSVHGADNSSYHYDYSVDGTHIPHPSCHKRVFTEHFFYIENKNRPHILT